MLDAHSHPSTVAAIPPVNWRNVIACGLFLTVLFTLLGMPLGGEFTLARFWPAYRTQAITIGLWVILVPAVGAAARRAHRAGVASLRGIAIHVLAGTALAFAHGAAFGILRWTLGLSTTGSVRSVVVATTAFVVNGNFLRYVVIAAAYHAIAFAREARERAVGEARMAEGLASARLAALERRLHPHFLFNTLNAVSTLIAANPLGARRMVEQLGDLLRAALNAEPGREVPLASELELLERYIAIELERFPDRLRIDVRVGSEERAALVPQLLLQPLVENAIRHGVAPREGPGMVLVTAERRGDELRLRVRDDGVGFTRAQQPSAPRQPRPPTIAEHAAVESARALPAAAAHENGAAPAWREAEPPLEAGGFGIAHTRERLAALYGSAFAMDIEPNAPTGTVVTIELPFRTAAMTRAMATPVSTASGIAADGSLISEPGLQ